MEKHGNNMSYIAVRIPVRMITYPPAGKCVDEYKAPGIYIYTGTSAYQVYTLHTV